MAKGINIFDSAKGKPKPSSSAKDKPTVEVDGIEAQLNELQNLKTQIANLETELDVVTDEIKTIAKEKFVELYLENGRNPNTFLLKDGSGCVMVIPTDKYISIKDEDRANQLIENYGEDIVTIDEKYYFNPEVLERNMKAIEKLIRDAKSIGDADKQNLLIREVKYSVTKGTIDELYDYGEDMEAVINDIQPIITLKNCGGKMAEGGTDGEFIANVYDDYDAEVGTTVTSMYAKGGMVVSDNDILDALSGFNNGLTLTSISEVIGLSNYRFGKYATESQMKNLQRKINNLIKNGYVKEGGVGYMLTNKIYSPSESKFAYGGMMAKGGIIAHGLKTGDKIISGRIIGTTIMVYNANNDEYAKIDLENGKRTKVIYDKKTKKYIEEKKDGGMMAKGGKIKVGDKIRIVQGLQGDYKSPKYANKIYEVINVRGNDFDVRSSEGYTETFKIGSSNYQKYADGGMTRGRMSVKKLIDEIRENGEFMDSYMIDESQTVSNAGEQESYLYNGKNYLITTWNERAENHFDGEENISIDEEYNEEYKLGGFFGNSRYNTGRSWHLDHARHNKKESYEKPLNKRSRRFKRK
jgi:hypothetical protein